jgi:hypothetical protein
VDLKLYKCHLIKFLVSQLQSFSQELRSGGTANFSVDVSKLEKDAISISAVEINFYRGFCPPSDNSIEPMYTIELSNRNGTTFQGEAQLNLPVGVYSTKVKAFSSTSGGVKYTYSGFSCSEDRGAYITIVAQ